MRPQSETACRTWTRVRQAGAIVAWLLALASCSTSAAPSPSRPPAEIVASPATGDLSGMDWPAVASHPPNADARSTPSVVPTARSTATATATGIPAESAGEAPIATLNGPFGSLDGTPAASGTAWPDASALLELDAYVRSAPLTVTLVDPDLRFTDWSVSARSTASPGPPDALTVRPYPDSGPELLRVTGPPTGDWLLRADVTTTGRAAGSYFWHLGVPDRDLPADGHVLVPAPRVLLATAGMTVQAVPGSGCYLGTCSDVGRSPSVSQLAKLSGARRSTLTLSLDDASRFVLWDVSVRPVHDGTTASASVDRGRNSLGVDHVTFRSPGRGDWYVSVSVTYDRGRGSYVSFARLVIP